MKTAWYRVEVNQELCIGCGFCEETRPDVFLLGDYTATVVVDQVSDERLESLMAAARDCPVEAIRIIPLSGETSADDDEERHCEEDGGEIREYERKHRDAADPHHIEPDHPKRLER